MTRTELRKKLKEALQQLPIHEKVALLQGLQGIDRIEDRLKLVLLHLPDEEIEKLTGGDHGQKE